MPSAERRWFSDLTRFAGLGIQLAVWVGLFATLGWFADAWLDTSPWLLLIACLMGAGLGMWDVVRSVLRDPQLGSKDGDRRDDPS